MSVDRPTDKMVTIVASEGFLSPKWSTEGVSCFMTMDGPAEMVVIVVASEVYVSPKWSNEEASCLISRDGPAEMMVTIVPSEACVSPLEISSGSCADVVASLRGVSSMKASQFIKLYDCVCNQSFLQKCQLSFFARFFLFFS